MDELAHSIPQISVLMGVLWRRETLELLRRSVDSILAQTVTELELLICDDGSSPAAAALLDAYSEKDPRVRLVRPGNKLDLASKLNACLAEARAPLIARMDDDDRSLPERFQKQLELLAARPDIAFVGSNALLIRNGEVCGERVFPALPQVTDFYMTQPFLHPALMFRREALDAVGGYSEGKRQLLCEDYDLLLRLYARGYRGMNLQEDLLEYTIPATAKGNRRMRHRWNETVTRWERFRELGALPCALPYVLKPLAVGLLPEKMLEHMKKTYYQNG